MSTGTKGAPDPDAVALLAMSEQAKTMALKESSRVVLRQVDTDLSVTDFRFVDGALTREIMVVIPEPDAPISQWKTVVNSVSPLLGQTEPGIDLQNLRIGPRRVERAVTTRWPGCGIRGMTLYLENNKLTWVVFCNTPEGVVSGIMDNQIGEFQPSDAPPAPIPVTATPVP